MKRGLLDRVAQKGLFPTPEVKAIVLDLHENHDPQDTAWQIVLDHLFPVRNRLLLLANKRAHPDMLVRDFDYTTEFTQSLALHDNALHTFESQQRSNGQIPTAVGIAGQTPWHFADDESTLLYVISTAGLTRQDGTKFTPVRRQRVTAALNFIDQRASNGMYATPKGDRRGWLDSFIYPRSDVVTQNQGLYAVTLLAADELGFSVDAGEIKTAAQLYKAMADVHGYLPLSAHFNEAPDISALYPEYVVMTMFGEQLLPDQVVSATLEQTPMSRHGYKVLTASPNGEYFDPSHFVDQHAKGKYQNGAVWPIWHNNALAVGELHRLVRPTTYQEAVMRQLDETGWPESIRTGGEFEHILTPENLRQVWNVKIPAQQRTLAQVAA